MKNKLKIKEILADLDIKSLIEAFNRGDKEWHKKEWEEFITLIRNNAIEECLKVMCQTEWDCKQNIPTKLVIEIKEKLNKLKG